jgi:hypothetical protein
MLPQKFDTTIAHKMINLMPELTGTDKRIAAAIIEHFNRKTGQCDPGLDRLAWLVGVSRRTAIRSVSHIVRVGVFRVVRHGGYSQRNSYEPVWLRFRELEAVWMMRFRAKSRHAHSSKMSPETCQTCHLPGDQPDTQTFLINQPEKTRSGLPKEEKGRSVESFSSVKKESINGTRPRDAAEAAAERRWNSALNEQFKSMPVTYGEVLEAITPEIQLAATKAEMRKAGAGLEYILDQLKLRAS